MSNFFTKLTSAVGVATLVAVSTSASLVSAASEFLPYAEVLADNGIISAQSTEAGYRLGNNITRAKSQRLSLTSVVSRLRLVLVMSILTLVLVSEIFVDT